MKKILIIFLIFICSCGTTQMMKRNPKCEDIKSFKVFQVLDNYVLAMVCRDGDDRYCWGHVVSFQKEKEIIYYDDQMIKVKNNECAIYIGSYQYQTKTGYKTVPIVKIIDSQITNSE